MTIADKLRIKSGDTVRLIATPDDYVKRLGELPEGVKFIEVSQKEASSAVHWFVRSVSDLESQFSNLVGELMVAERVWIVYPRKVKYNEGDANRNSIWKYFEKQGWKAVANYPIDGYYSAIWIKTKR